MTKRAPAAIPNELIDQKIYLIRHHQVMLDEDLAELYGVTTGNLNLAVRRNPKRFPADFMFQLNREETQAPVRAPAPSLWIACWVWICCSLPMPGPACWYLRYRRNCDVESTRSKRFSPNWGPHDRETTLRASRLVVRSLR